MGFVIKFVPMEDQVHTVGFLILHQEGHKLLDMSSWTYNDE